MWRGKRFFDFCCSLFGLILLFPVFLLVAAWIKKDSPGPIFFRQVRVGYRRNLFRIHKFRTMRKDSDSAGLQITVGEDARITSSGKFLRKYKIDELPQLIDVLFGQMSLVGPRPEVPKYVAFYSSEDQKIAFSVKPGITDWASIEFKNENDILGHSQNPEKDYIEKILPIKLKYHVRYANNASFFEDIRIIFRTIKEIFISR